ncbi:uncharacterized protein B0H64DRAFT_32239 [Chaetomium fimeti]|uniref:Uncharacterized protein n=1 Tax=Chaetomium fimeti TaxID=1854472 RepID=A0AAE0HR20_9PEZI|nr:hypothetical protein B0H64DRAFT_32239 [Chaetomium fimeti]
MIANLWGLLPSKPQQSPSSSRKWLARWHAVHTNIADNCMSALFRAAVPLVALTKDGRGMGTTQARFFPLLSVTSRTLVRWLGSASESLQVVGAIVLSRLLTGLTPGPSHNIAAAAFLGFARLEKVRAPPLPESRMTDLTVGHGSGALSAPFPFSPPASMEQTVAGVGTAWALAAFHDASATRSMGMLGPWSGGTKGRSSESPLAASNSTPRPTLTRK